MNIQCHTDVPPNCVPVPKAVASIASSLSQQRLAPREIAALPIEVYTISMGEQ